MDGANSVGGHGDHVRDHSNHVGGHGNQALVRLNVGGQWYTTTRATLLSTPDSIFHSMLGHSNQNGVLSNQQNGYKNEEEVVPNTGYYFIDRDGELFTYILNYLRSGELHCPVDFKEYDQLLQEAKFFGLEQLASDIVTKKEGKQQCHFMEVIEIAHPEKVGLCCCRIVLNEALRDMSPFSEVMTEFGSESEIYEGTRGRFWVRSTMTRLDWAETLTSHGWKPCGHVAFIRKIPDVTGRGTDMTHVVEKWMKHK